MNKNVCVVAQFYGLSKVQVSLFWGMAMHDDEFNLKENKTCIKKKKWIEPRSYKNMKI